ncbi:unnamed protein product, partial [Iphiclides podalirius]
MLLCLRSLIYCIVVTGVCALEHNIYIINSNYLTRSEDLIQTKDLDLDNFLQEADPDHTEKVSIQLYYETLCPDCIQFVIRKFTPVVQSLSPYLNIQIYPYGKAKTFGRNGRYEFKCQHGPEECYGNKLHACAIDFLQNMTQAVFFNACMLEPRNGKHGSNDKAAEACGTEQNVDATPIKLCAKGDKGSRLLKYYGDESKKANFNYVPYTLINGNIKDGDNFLNDVCAAFKNAPPPCRKLIKEEHSYKVVTCRSDQLSQHSETVYLVIYYESLCGDSRDFFTKQLTAAYELLEPFLDVRLIPYGKATTRIVDSNEYYTFNCHHGPSECYGNKLHACALDIYTFQNSANKFNACLMDTAHKARGSDDTAVNICGAALALDVKGIMECAKNKTGIFLLNYYGQRTKMTKFKKEGRAEFVSTGHVLYSDRGEEPDGSGDKRDTGRSFIINHGSYCGCL